MLAFILLASSLVITSELINDLLDRSWGMAALDTALVALTSSAFVHLITQ